MAPSKIFPDFPLPLELLCEIIKLLPLRHPNALFGISSHTKSGHTLHIWTSTIFGGHTTQSTQHSSDGERCESGHNVRLSVLMFVLMTYFLDIIWHRKLELHVSSDYRAIVDQSTSQFLESLPNLQVLDIGEVVPQYLSRFISSTQHTALIELVLYTSCAPVKGPPIAGLAGLEKLSINWYAYDNPKEPGSSLAHLYEFIRPSLSMLVQLKIEPFDVIDLQMLKPAADTLRTFEYTIVEKADESILDSIPAILPHLTKLSIIWDFSEKHSILWEVCTIFFYFHT